MLARGPNIIILSKIQILFLNNDKYFVDPNVVMKYISDTTWCLCDLLYGMKFLRELYFADWRFFCFAGSNFCDLERLIFPAGS